VVLVYTAVAPGFPKKTKYSLYVCPGCTHDTYSNRNRNYQRTMLYYISNIVTTDLTLLQSIAEMTTLNLHFGSPYSTGTVDWGYTRLVLLKHLEKLCLWITIWYPSKIFVDCKASVSTPYSASITWWDARLKRLTWLTAVSIFSWSYFIIKPMLLGYA
jgi:hypothetical protein